MAKYLEVTVRIPIREQYENDPKVIKHIAGAVEVSSLEELDISAGVGLSEDFIEQIQDVPLAGSLAHLKSAEVVEI